MSFFVHTSIFKVNVSIRADGYEGLPAEGIHTRIAAVSALFAGNEKVLLTKRRRPAIQEAHSDDTYPALDLVFDGEAIATLSRTLFASLGVLRLSDLSYRFLDFGFLYVVARFNVAGSAEALFEAPLTDISRCQKTLLNDLRAGAEQHTLFTRLAEQQLIESTSSLPNMSALDLLGTSVQDLDDHYAYATHMFLVQDDSVSEYKAAFNVLPLPELAFGDIAVHLSHEYPLWVSPRHVDAEELMYLLEADCLYLAEATFYSSCINSYQNILKQFVAGKGVSIASKPSRALISTSQRKLLSSNELRHLLIRDKLMIAQIAGRTECFDSDQNKYVRECKQLYSLDQGYDLYKDMEDTLKYVVHDQEEKSKEDSDAVVEVTLGAFTALALLSVINDMADFITKDKVLPEPWPWERTLLLGTIVALLAVLVYRHWTRRLRH